MYIKEVLEITCYNSPTFLTPGKYAVEICPKFCCWATGSARICPLYCLCEFITALVPVQGNVKKKKYSNIWNQNKYYDNNFFIYFCYLFHIFHVI